MSLGMPEKFAALSENSCLGPSAEPVIVRDYPLKGDDERDWARTKPAGMPAARTSAVSVAAPVMWLRAHQAAEAGVGEDRLWGRDGEPRLGFAERWIGLLVTWSGLHPPEPGLVGQVVQRRQVGWG